MCLHLYPRNRQDLLIQLVPMALTADHCWPLPWPCFLWILLSAAAQQNCWQRDVQAWDGPFSLGREGIVTICHQSISIFVAIFLPKCLLLLCSPNPVESWAFLYYRMLSMIVDPPIIFCAPIHVSMFSFLATPHPQPCTTFVSFFHLLLKEPFKTQKRG